LVSIFLAVLTTDHVAEVTKHLALQRRHRVTWRAQRVFGRYGTFSQRTPVKLFLIGGLALTNMTLDDTAAALALSERSF
jgi:hypothetical protein